MTPVLTAVSGGVDSAVALWLLKEQGFSPEALFITMYEGRETEASFEAASRICERLGVRLRRADARELFRRRVIDYFAGSYLHAETPNPCVVCNPEVKFRILAQTADRLGIEKVATGHYAAVHTTSRGHAFLLTASDRQKDQTYFLHRLQRSMLSRVVFPLGRLRKDQVRKRAEELGIGAVVRQESQEICFLKDDAGLEPGGYRGFVRSILGGPSESGPILDTKGRLLGRHKGLFNYTVGQRRGLGLPDKSPWYVLKLDFAANTLIVGKEHELYTSTLTLTDVNLLVPFKRALFSPCRVKIRYRARPASAVVGQGPDGTMTVRFRTPQRAVTPGQFAVFYRGRLVLGGGCICG